MNFKFLVFIFLLFTGFQKINAQENQTISLDEAVKMALSNSDRSKISDSKVETSKNELAVTKNNRYPDVDVSGQYMYLTNATIDLQIPINSSENTDAEPAEPAAAPNVNFLLLGQANVSMPIFSGFRLKNSIKASEFLYEAASLNAKNDKEQIALTAIVDYINLYKADRAIGIIQESLKSAQQRVTDFSNMEQNGLLARNDLLKANLQESNTQLSLEEARKNRKILNYKLVTFLKLPAGTEISTTDSNFGMMANLNPAVSISRNDLEALRYQEQAAQSNIKVAQANYFPSIALVGGYTALDLHNALTVTNALNVGVGVSYNFASIFKNKSNVKVAESKANELKYTLDMVSDQVKLEIENAEQEYELAVKKYDVFVKSEEQAIENYRIVKDKYDNGLSDTNDLLEADVQQLQSKMNKTFGKATITQKYYELLTAEGKLTNEFNNK